MIYGYSPRKDEVSIFIKLIPLSPHVVSVPLFLFTCAIHLQKINDHDDENWFLVSLPLLLLSFKVEVRFIDTVTDYLLFC